MPLRNLEMMLTPNAWSCLPSAAAMLLHAYPKAVIDGIGHDGSEILFPEMKSPHCRRGFHIQEIVDVFIDQYEFPVLFEAQPCLIGLTEDGEEILWPLPENEGRIQCYMEDAPGIIIGTHEAETLHAVAWDGDVCWDPRGQKYPAKEMEIIGFIGLF